MTGQREIVVSASGAGSSALPSSHVSAQNTVSFKLNIIGSTFATATIANLFPNRKQILRAVGTYLLVCGLLVGVNARSQAGDTPPEGFFVTFDPPGSTLTFPSAISRSF
jgi:hypothetical protein